ncbi:MAG TPA: inositol-3-phosphate synthase, partial [Candidatus Fimivivens sp.]|nr:inositol-3-phosphate synthase [Candidatus Fimivivens sp.]
MKNGGIKVAIVGVGNCASSLIQGLEYYKDVDENSERVIGLMNNVLGGYRISDIEVVAAFDVNANKVGKDISAAVFAEPNCTKKISDVPTTGVKVSAGPLFDGIAPHMKDRFPLVQEPDDVDAVLKESGAEILVSYLPAGSQEATYYWAEKALQHKVAFINAIPVFVCSDKERSARFEQAGIPCGGDDIKSQVGATIVHRVLTQLVLDRGQSVDDTYQLDIGGNTDFENMMTGGRYALKRESKTEAIAWNGKIGAIKLGNVDYVPHLKDNKVAYINIRGRQFGDIPFEIDAKLSVEDSPNSAGV